MTVRLGLLGGGVGFFWTALLSCCLSCFLFTRGVASSLLLAALLAWLGFLWDWKFPSVFSLRLLNESRVFSFSFSFRFLVYLVLRLFQFGVAGSLFVALFIYLFIYFSSASSD